jgi:glycosyltransferase involved in cell wall biosynthesis
MIKILHIISSLNDGGAEGVMTKLAINKNREFKHFVIALKDGGKYQSILESNGVKVNVFKIHSISSAIKNLPKLILCINTISPNIVQTWMYHADVIGGSLAKILGIKVVVWNVRSGELHPTQKLSTKVFIRVSSLMSKFIPVSIISCSNRAIQIHKNIGYSDKFQLIDNGVNKNIFKLDSKKRSLFRAEIKVNDACILFGTVARFDPQKDHKSLLRAINMIDKKYNCKFLFVGSNMHKDNAQLNNWICKYKLNDRIILAGQRKDIQSVMCGIDYLILPSLYGEAFPNVIIESMSVGKPAIVTDIGDSKRIVKGLGWVTPPGSSKALSKAINFAAELITNNYSEYQRMSILAIKTVNENYTLDVMNLKYQDHWKTLLNQDD